jgi:WD40 repeat protein
VWVDWEDIAPASQWEQDIDDSIDAADSFVFVVSGHSLASEYCLGELRHAQERGKRIVPLACDGADPSDAPEALRQLNWIWCRESDDRDAAFGRLTSALDTDLAWAKAHTRLLVRAVEWDARHDGSLLLRGRDLEEAAQQLALNASKEPVPTELQQRYVHESRRAAAKRQRTLLGGVSLALLVAIALGVLALLQRNDARRATRAATSVALASAANDRVAARPDQAALLALAAYKSSASPDARNAVVTALETARELGVAEFVHSDAPVGSLAFAPDGRTLAVGGADGAVRLWDLRAGKQLAELSEPGRRAVVSVAFAAGGRRLMVGTEHGVVRLWDVPSARPVGRTLRASGTIVASAVAADARTVAAIGGGRRVWLWDVRSGSRRRLLGPLGDGVTIALSPDGRMLAACASLSEGHVNLVTVRVWDVASGKALGDLPTDALIAALAFAPDNRTLATGSASDVDATAPGELRLWDARSRTPLAQPVRVRSAVESIAFARDGRTIALGEGAGPVELSTVRARRRVGSVRGVAANVAVSPDGRVVAAAGNDDPSVRVWNLRQRPRFVRALRGDDHVVSSVAFSHDAGTLAAADEFAVRLVDVESATSHAPKQLRGGAYVSPTNVAFGGDRATLAVGYDDGSVRFWDGRRLVGRLPGRLDAETTALAFDGEGAVLAAATDDGVVRLWDVSQRRPRGKPVHTRGAIAATFEDGGRTLVTAAADGSVESWDVATAKRNGPRVRPATDVVSAAFAPDGRTTAFASSLGTVSLWDRRGKAAPDELARVGGPAVLSFSPDGRTLAAAAEGGAVYLWDVDGHRPLGRPLGHTNYAMTVAFSPDGRNLVSAGDTVRLWKGILWRDDADLRAQVCGLVLGDLTRAEWAAVAPGLSYRKTCDA